MAVFWPNHPSHPNLPASASGWTQGGHSVVIQAVNRPDLTVSVLLDKDGSKPDAVGGQWEQHARPRDTNLLEWAGRRNWAQTLAIVLDGWPQREAWGMRWMDHYMRLIDQMSEWGTPIRLIGPVFRAEYKWVIDEVTYGEFIIDPDSGRHVRQHMSLHLTEYITGEELEKLPRSTATPKSFRWYSVREGEDLERVALRALGRAGRWPEIVALNEGMRDPKLYPKRFPSGTAIKVPKD